MTVRRAQTITTPLPQIPIIDLGKHSPVALLHSHSEHALRILDIAHRRYPRWLISLGDRLCRRWLHKGKHRHVHEIAVIANHVTRAGTWFLNASYEWGCTSGIQARGDGMRLVRVLDWPLDGLGRHIVAARHDSHAGPWINLTWPGFVGTIQGMAAGRFAAAFNQAPIHKVTGLYAADRVVHLGRVLTNHERLPAHLLRDVFERCETYEEAKRRIVETPLCAPAFFSLVGTRPGEGCIIERAENRAVVHDHVADRPVAIANNWLTEDIKGLPERDDNEERHQQMLAALPDAETDLSWLKPPILSDRTRLVMIAEPATGHLVAQGWEADGPATAPVEINQVPPLAEGQSAPTFA